MSIRVLKGLPGAGKSLRLITEVNAARAAGRSVATFACSESPWLAGDENVRDRRIIGCRRPGVVCALDYLVSSSESAALVRSLDPPMLLAFDEAYYFSPQVAVIWSEASKQGFDVLVAMPSEPQLSLLRDEEYVELTLQISCQECGRAAAETFVLHPTRLDTLALCKPCDAALASAAEQEIVQRLQANEPYPGERVIYQPVGLSDCESWDVLRPDSTARAAIMTRVLEEHGLAANGHENRTYLDVGCNTGYFCGEMSKAGLRAQGVDVVEGTVDIARLLSAFVRRDYTRYLVADCYEYLRDSQQQRFDVTSAFSVFQWLMIQRTVGHGIECLERLFRKTNRICFLEMGYSDEEHYRDRIGIDITQEWVREEMERRGDFREIVVLEKNAHPVMRDLFIGVK